MSWTCPNCERTFTRNKQWHSCEKHELVSLFIDKPQFIRDLYDHLIKEVEKIGPMEVHVSKWNITLRHSSTFMSIFPEKKDLALAIVCDKPIDDFPIYDSHQYSKQRWSNHVKIEEPGEIDSQLLGWIRDAYFLCS
jgi:hypothetical protein